MFDTVITGGVLVDGTGTPLRSADVGITDGTIHAIGDLTGAPAARVIDAAGAVVAPGFVDIHSHSDFTVLSHPEATSKILQGVTTEVVGNCGLAVVPVTSAGVVDALRPLMTYHNDPSVTWDWRSVADYRRRVEAAAPLLDVVVLAGHNAVRASVLGLAKRPATHAETAEMQALLDVALSEGARGMSVGLMYPPSMYAELDELVALGEVLARHDALLASHMVDYADNLLGAVDDMLAVAERSGCRLQISHLAVVGSRNWPLMEEAIARIEAAVDRGVDVAFDAYPYLAGSTNLSQLVPGWALDGGFDAFVERLGQPDLRQRMLDAMADRSMGWDEVLVVSIPWRAELNGRSIDQIAEEFGVDGSETVLRLLEHGDPTIVAFGRSEDVMRRVLGHPLAMIGSDGVAVPTEGEVGGPTPHPRFFGAFPGFFQRLVRERPLVSLERAVAMCTSQPADRLRLADRGRLVEGLRADIVVFDPATITEHATYTDSRRHPSGIHRVLVAGREVARDGAVSVG